METFKQNVATDKESGETWREWQHGIWNPETELQKQKGNTEYRINYK